MSYTTLQERESIAKEILTAITLHGGSEGASVDDIKNHLNSNLEKVPDAENIEWCLNDAVEKDLLIKLPNGNYKLKKSTNLTHQAGQTLVGGLKLLSDGVAKITHLHHPSQESAAQEKEKKEETDAKTSPSDDKKSTSDVKKSSSDVKQSSSDAKTSSDVKKSTSDVKQSSPDVKQSSSDAKKSASDVKKSTSDDKKTSSNGGRKKFCGIC